MSCIVIYDHRTFKECWLSIVEPSSWNIPKRPNTWRKLCVSRRRRPSASVKRCTSWASLYNFSSERSRSVIFTLRRSTRPRWPPTSSSQKVSTLLSWHVKAANWPIFNGRILTHNKLNKFLMTRIKKWWKVLIFSFFFLIKFQITFSNSLRRCRFVPRSSRKVLGPVPGR